MARRTRVDGRCGIVAALIPLACAVLGGCTEPPPYTDNASFPGGTYYTVVVRPGDTVSGIAARYDVSASDVEHLNKISERGVIHQGQTLRIPADSDGTRDAVLAEATNATARNYAPPPKPIDVGRFGSREHVVVRSIAPPVPGKSPAATTEIAAEAPRHARADDAPDARTAEVASTTRSNGHFVWPVTGPVISSFGTMGRGERNDGINIAAATGTPIHAAAAGTVTYAGDELKSYGNLVLIQHDDGYVTAYAHAESISVSRGTHVDKGEIIGLAGATGDVDRPQLHFEIRKGVQPINPRLLLASTS